METLHASNRRPGCIAITWAVWSVESGMWHCEAGEGTLGFAERPLRRFSLRSTADHIFTKYQCSFRQSLRRQRENVFVHGLRRVFEACTMNFRCLHDQTWGEVKKMQDEIIRMLGLDIEFAEDMRRKNPPGCRSQ